MTWQPQLQGKIRLVVDREGPVNSIVASYAWVRIDEPRPFLNDQDDDMHKLEAVSIKRAVMLSWATLAACPGYSGSENGTFWKRVISALQENPGKQWWNCGRGQRRRRPDNLEYVTDANGFFDSPGHSFPRFLVQDLNSGGDAVGELFTADGPALAPSVRATLEPIMTRLQRITGDLPRADIDVCVWGYTSRDLHHTITRIANETSPDARVSRFKISQCQYSVDFSNSTRIGEFMDLVRNVSVRIDQVHVASHLNESHPSDRANALRALLRLDGFGVKAQVTSLRLSRGGVNDAVFRAVMSALPFATSIHSLRLTDPTIVEDMFEQADLPWIGYAMFHPSADSSTWKHLEIDWLKITEHSTHVLKAMATGNNLLALMNGMPPAADAYYSADLLPGTIVQLQPDPSSEVLFISPIRGVTVDVCGIPSIDRATWDEWVAIIVPAFGLGWVRQHEVCSCRAHEPARVGLTGLRLIRKKTRRNEIGDAPEVLLHFLLPLGFRLSFLDVSAYTHVSDTTLNEILCACPSLKVLKVNHSGSLWSEATVVSHKSRLEELELITDEVHPDVFTRAHIVSSLRNLRALRIQVSRSSGVKVQARQASLERLFAFATSLSYFHWQLSTTFFRPYPWMRLVRINQRVPYAIGCKWTITALLQLKLTNLSYLAAEGPMNPACALAFLSVVARERGDSALGRLCARGVLAIIFEFATSPTHRFIYIEPDDEQLEAARAQAHTPS